MNQIAFVWNDIYIYWSGIVITAAALAAMLAAIGFRMQQNDGVLDVLVTLPVGTFLALLCARFVHWYCFYRQYTGFVQAFTDYSVGGFSLSGAFFGVILAVLIVRLLRINTNMLRLLDAMAPAAALGIGVGRFSASFNSFDRGTVILANPKYHGLPFSTEITNSVGNAEWHTAVFFWEGVAALVLFVILAVLFFVLLNKESKQGMVFCLFLLLYGSVEIMLDSMRYDSAFLRSNGFVSLVQIIGLTTMIVEMVVFSIRRIKKAGMKLSFIPVWVLFTAGAGLAGFSEYYVQRHGDKYVFSYSLMTVGLLFSVVMTLIAMIWAFKKAEAPEPEETEAEKA